MLALHLPLVVEVIRGRERCQPPQVAPKARDVCHGASLGHHAKVTASLAKNKLQLRPSVAKL